MADNIVQMQDPFTAASDTAGAFADKYQTLKDAAQKRADEQAALKQAQDNADREFNLAKTGQEATIHHQGFEENRETISDAAAKELADYTKSRRVHQEHIDALDTQLKSMAVNDARRAGILQQQQIEQNKITLGDAAFTSHILRTHGQQDADAISANLRATGRTLNAQAGLYGSEAGLNTERTHQMQIGHTESGGLNEPRGTSGKRPDEIGLPGLQKNQIENLILQKNGDTDHDAAIERQITKIEHDWRASQGQQQTDRGTRQGDAKINLKISALARQINQNGWGNPDIMNPKKLDVKPNLSPHAIHAINIYNQLIDKSGNEAAGGNSQPTPQPSSGPTPVPQKPSGAIEEATGLQDGTVGGNGKYVVQNGWWVPK